ncbi:MAG: hypothetical protein P9L99_06555 [Candidatus Lernaella stagnicola]|nr:hypothetical protein [Candidatus Lernaella stagnicola]
MKKTTLRRVLLIAALCSASVAAAATILPLTWQQLIEKSERVALVEAISRSVEEYEGIPTTLVTCRVTQTYRGTPGASLVLRLPGGKRGDLTMRIPGAPLPEVGDTFLVFGRGDGTRYGGRDVLRPVGMGQGMLAVVEKSGRRWVVQVLGRAPERFAACDGAGEACRRQVGTLAEPLANLGDLLAAPQE